MLERRFNKTEVRLVDMGQASSPGTAVGYAAVFDKKSELLGSGFREVIDNGAFTRFLKRPGDVIATVDHDPSKLIGRLRNKSLQLATDAKGLKARIELPDTSVGRDLAVQLRNGNISQMSFAFQVDPDGDSWDEMVGCSCDDPDCDDPNCPNGERTKIPVRTLRSVTVRDVACVASPAYPQTSVSLMSASDIPAAVWGRSLPETVPYEIRTRIESRLSARDRRRAMSSLVLSL